MPEKIGEYPLGAGQSITVLLQTQPREDTTMKTLIALLLTITAAQADTYYAPTNQWTGTRSLTQPGYIVSKDTITETVPGTKFPAVQGKNYVRHGDQWNPTTGPANIPDISRPSIRAEED